MVDAATAKANRRNSLIEFSAVMFRAMLRSVNQCLCRAPLEITAA
jgi:hypothetical protein